MINSTISGNSAGEDGGGIAAVANAGISLINSTVSGNNAADLGGGILGFSGSTITLTNSTVSGNSADISGSGIANFGTTTLTNSIVLGNAGDEISGSGALNNNNSITSGSAADVFASIDPDTGGGVLDEATGTIALLASGLNPALDAGDNDAFTAAIPTGVDAMVDALGEERFVDQTAVDDAISGGLGTIDLGAVELQTILVVEDPSLIVTTTDDVVDNTDGVTSLREAIAFANSDPSASIITFDAGIFDGSDNTITFADGAVNLVISSDITIDASTVGGVTVDADGQDRVFAISDPGTDATFINLTITGGDVVGPAGGIFIGGAGPQLSLIDSIVSNNNASTFGGGIVVDETLFLINSTVSDNTAGDDGGGIAGTGTITLTNSTVSGNAAGDDGGGI